MIMIMILKFIIITVINYYHNILYSKLGNIYFYLSYKLKRKLLSTNERADLKLGQDYEAEDINLLIKKGETVAFVGKSGAGKTTLMSLLPRFYDGYEGDIKIDDISIKE